MFVRASHFRAGLVFVLLLLSSGRVAAESPLHVKAGATAGQIDKMPGFSLGGALALARWSPSPRLTFVPQVELLFARRNATFAVDEAGSLTYALDFIELPLLLRTEFAIGGRPYYALAGVHGRVLLGAQRTNADGIVDRADIASRVDLGLLAAGGVELGSFAWGELFMELRYQRGYRALVRGSDDTHEALSLLLNYGLGAETSDSVSWARGRHLAVKAGLVATRLPASEFASLGPGISFGGAFSPGRIGSRVALVPQIELAFVHRSAHDAGDRSLALDSLDLSMIVRGEIAIGEAAVYGLGGVYGGALLRAQRTDAGVTTDVRDAVSAVDAGWLAGAGIELDTRTPSEAIARAALSARDSRSPPRRPR